MVSGVCCLVFVVACDALLVVRCCRDLFELFVVVVAWGLFVVCSFFSLFEP